MFLSVPVLMVLWQFYGRFQLLRYFTSVSVMEEEEEMTEEEQMIRGSRVLPLDQGFGQQR